MVIRNIYAIACTDRYIWMGEKGCMYLGPKKLRLRIVFEFSLLMFDHFCTDSLSAHAYLVSRIPH